MKMADFALTMTQCPILSVTAPLSTRRRDNELKQRFQWTLYGLTAATGGAYALQVAKERFGFEQRLINCAIAFWYDPALSLAKAGLCGPLSVYVALWSPVVPGHCVHFASLATAVFCVDQHRSQTAAF